MANNINPNNNAQKRDEILDIWYRLTGEIFKKVNLAKNAEVFNADVASKKEYLNLVKQKEIPLVAENSICLAKNQDLHIVNFGNTHYYDLKNPQKGIENKTNFLDIRAALENKEKKDKTVAFFSGNFVGEEWVISALNNASITDTNKLLFWGLKTRVNQLIKDIIYVAENGADEIILMNGREEHKAKKALNTDILKDICYEKFNGLLYRYVVQKVTNKLNKKNRKVTISYVEGVKKVFNIEKTWKENKKEHTLFFDLSMHTNLKTTSTTLNGNYQAAVKQHGNLAKADVVCIASENAAGIPDQANNVVLLSGLSKYKNTTKGNLPALAPKNFNSFTLMLGDEDHEVQIVKSANFVNEKSFSMEKKIATEEAKIEYLAQLAKQKVQEKLNSFADREVDYNTMFKNSNTTKRSEDNEKL